MIALLATTLVACSGDNEEEGGKKEAKAISLKTDQDKWSYAIGHDRAAQVLSPQNPNLEQFKKYKPQLIEGFKSGYRELNVEEQQKCMTDIQSMLGNTNGATFNAENAEVGCKAYGVYVAASTYLGHKQADILGIVDVDVLKAGFVDGLEGGKVRLNEEERKAAITKLDSEVQRLQAEKAEKDAEAFKENKAAGEEFLAQNAKKPGVKVTASGLQYEVIKAGSGAKPTLNSNVTVHYHGTLIDGTVFDSSVDRGQPASFGVGQVIRGWTEALQLMPTGSKYRLYIPQELAYGASPRPGGPIQPFSALIFDVELISIQ